MVNPSVSSRADNRSSEKGFIEKGFVEEGCASSEDGTVADRK